jgi:hypothetical protein
MIPRCLTKWCALAAAFCCVSVFAAEAMAKGDKHDKREKHERYEEKEYKEKEERGHDKKHESYFHKHSHTRLRIPPGHYPPPGECRIWYPDRPAGHQPEHIKCGMVPPRGAWVLHYPRHRKEHLNIRVYDPQRSGVMISIGEFNLKSGEFIRELDSDNDD